jgi:hypothetical protein
MIKQLIRQFERYIATKVLRVYFDTPNGFSATYWKRHPHNNWLTYKPVKPKQKKRFTEAERASMASLIEQGVAGMRGR